MVTSPKGRFGVMQTRLLRFLPLVLVLVVAAVLLIPVPAAASPGEFKAGDLYSNDGTTFQYGVNPSTFQGGTRPPAARGTR